MEAIGIVLPRVEFGHPQLMPALSQEPRCHFDIIVGRIPGTVVNTRIRSATILCGFSWRRAAIGYEVAQGYADLRGRVLLDIVNSFHTDLLLIRPTATEIARGTH